MPESLEDTLKEMLKKGKAWDRKPTTLPGVFILKLPEYKRTPPRLAVEINPVDEYGRPTKRRGLILRTVEELKMYRELISSEKLNRLLKILDKINPSISSRKGLEGALEI